MVKRGAKRELLHDMSISLWGARFQEHTKAKGNKVWQSPGCIKDYVKLRRLKHCKPIGGTPAKGFSHDIAVCQETEGIVDPKDCPY